MTAPSLGVRLVIKRRTGRRDPAEQVTIPSTSASTELGEVSGQAYGHAKWTHGTG
ncbi:MAG: hypothetical protein ACE5R6_20955 [Candidatus Heimdallarchaeota archaeon]